MKIKKFIALFLAAAMLFPLAACNKRNGSQSPTRSTEASTEPTAAPTTAVNNANEDEIQLGPFTFDEDEAEYLGSFDSEIYEKVRAYYQDQRIVLFDPYDTQIGVLYAYSYEPNYEDTPIELIGEDVNFDGYTDFYLLYSQANFNSYYFFWIWNMQKRTFEYYLPLSSVPSPDVDAQTRRIHSSDRVSEETLRTTDYEWKDGEITPVSFGEQTIDINNTNPSITGPEDVDPKMVIIDGHVLSSVSLNLNQKTQSDWLCRIENESILRIASNIKDIFTNTRKFVFRGYYPGTTTVILRYAKNWNDPYVVQKILNVTVNADYTLRIVATQ